MSLDVDIPRPRAKPSRDRARRRHSWTAALTVLLLVAGAVVGGVWLARQRLQERTLVTLPHAVLAARGVPLGSPDAAVVSSVTVVEHQRVVRGQVLARLKPTGDMGDTARHAHERMLIAPTSGVIASVTQPSGSVVKAGDPVLTLYDPALLNFAVEVPAEILSTLRVGMRARIMGPGLASPITARVGHAAARVVSGGTTDGAVVANELTVTLVPDSPAAVSHLLPGLAFSAVLDRRSAPPGAASPLDAGGG